MRKQTMRRWVLNFRDTDLELSNDCIVWRPFCLRNGGFGVSNPRWNRIERSMILQGRAPPQETMNKFQGHERNVKLDAACYPVMGPTAVGIKSFDVRCHDESSVEGIFFISVV